MAWKVYGFMEGKEGNTRFPNRDLPVYGPLPRKRWVNQPGERYRVKRAKPTFRSAATPREYNEGLAIEYAKWLAHRDGKVVADLEACAQWDVTDIGAKRICAVLFGVKDRYRGTFKTEVRIAIPHWDFEPAEPIEHFDDAVESVELESVFA